MDRDTDVAQSQRELDILRARDALYDTWVRGLRVFFVAVALLFAIRAAVVGSASGRTDSDDGGIVAALMVFCLIIYFIVSPRHRPRGWIDLTEPPLPFACPQTGVGILFGTRPSEALIIEEQIAARERRLVELGVTP